MRHFVFLHSIFIQVCLDLMYFYECIEISNVFKKSDHDYTLYTSKEIDWFGIKDNIKIGCQKLKFILQIENVHLFGKLIWLNQRCWTTHLVVTHNRTYALCTEINTSAHSVVAYNRHNFSAKCVQLCEYKINNTLRFMDSIMRGCPLLSLEPFIF